MTTTDQLQDKIVDQLRPLRQAASRLVKCSEKQINDCLRHLAELTEAHTEDLLAANQLDLARMDPKNPKYDRLLLSEARLQSIASDLRKVADLPSPLGEVLEERRLRNGLQLKRVRVPIGVIGIVFESRPNVTFDVFALTLKSGNVSVLKGSRDATDSNLAIKKLIDQALEKFDLSGCCLLAPAEREALLPILQADGLVDMIIPRGSQGLINYVRQHASVPVIETGAGICHVYVDATANPKWAKDIITNAKARRVSVCNALDCLVLHRSKLNELAAMVETLGSQHACEIFADAEAFATLQTSYPQHLLQPAEEVHFGTEFLSMRMAIKTVGSLGEALDHIAAHGSQHSEAIVSDDAANTERFLKEVDAAAVYANTSTAFTDGGEFDLGAEIGISTQKLHARGPMGLKELTSYKYLMVGQGQVR
ncbi:MAG: glutamate-5-semialdehyde dehydrogenase [Bacteroidota bacterium]